MITSVVYRHIGVDETPQCSKICLTPPLTAIIMDNSHDPKNDDCEALPVLPDVDSPVFA